MSDETYKRAKAEIALIKAVNADPRVIAAREAYDTFLKSEAGQHLDAAVHKKETWALVDEDLKDTLEAFGFNWARTRTAVRAKLKPQFHPVENES
jgi:hypothetical protein